MLHSLWENEQDEEERKFQVRNKNSIHNLEQ